MRAGEAKMRRAVIGFETDDEGHWVARLECGHGQHVRHDPPWTSGVGDDQLSRVAKRMMWDWSSNASL